ncbi:hypothetical protein [Ferrovibrio sp.]|uniref:hypothetical protein n=1 Tax=Ferrovibrio sp. TaxID=1917215 RepID=UPI0035B04D03
MTQPYALYNPATHVAVPREPTGDMEQAFEDALPRLGDKATHANDKEKPDYRVLERDFAPSYEAMLAAAPPHAVEIDPTRSDVALAKLILERLGYSVEGGQHRVDWVAEELCKFREAK